MLKKIFVYLGVIILANSMVSLELPETFQLMAAPPADLKVHLLNNKEITINIWMKERKAVLYLMGNHMFHMSAKYFPIRGSNPKNVIELKGNGFREMYLNRSRKVLYFREGTDQMKGVFAKVSITREGKKMVVKFVKNDGIDINIDMKKRNAVMYFKGSHMFKMSAGYLPIRGSGRLNLIELKGDGFRKIHLNRGRKILYFREGTEGVFANVSIN
jgi:hypothetical protein